MTEVTTRSNVWHQCFILSWTLPLSSTRHLSSFLAFQTFLSFLLSLLSFSLLPSKSCLLFSLLQLYSHPFTLYFVLPYLQFLFSQLDPLPLQSLPIPSWFFCPDRLTSNPSHPCWCSKLKLENSLAWKIQKKKNTRSNVIKFNQLKYRFNIQKYVKSLGNCLMVDLLHWNLYGQVHIAH